MQKTSAELASFVQGRLEGDSGLVITGFAGLKDARKGHVSFLENPRYSGLLTTTLASVVLVGEGVETPSGLTVIRVKQPSAAFSQIVSLEAPPAPVFHAGVHPTAVIASSATIDPTASIQPHVVIEPDAVVGANSVIGAGSYLGHGARVGQDCLIYPRVVIRERCMLGDRVIVHSGAVIGSDGFGYEFQEGRYEKIPQVGFVRMEDDVEIGANATIDRGRFGCTWLKRGVKIDNLVQIAHNVVVDEHSAIAAQAGISGSTSIGKHVRVAGQVGTVGHITIGDGAILGAQSGINHDVAKGEFMFGYPAQPHKEAMKMHASIRRLPYLIERLRKLEAMVATLLKNRGES